MIEMVFLRKGFEYHGSRRPVACRNPLVRWRDAKLTRASRRFDILSVKKGESIISHSVDPLLVGASDSRVESEWHFSSTLLDFDNGRR